jgi:hypothetical protein
MGARTLRLVPLLAVSARRVAWRCAQQLAILAPMRHSSHVSSERLDGSGANAVRGGEPIARKYPAVRCSRCDRDLSSGDHRGRRNLRRLWHTFPSIEVRSGAWS